VSTVSRTATCRRCGTQVAFEVTRLPLICTEMDVDGERSFVMIASDDWVLHRCVITKTNQPATND